MMKIGLIKEGKIPTDTRVALSPIQCASFKHNFPELALVVQPSNNRCYSNEEYNELEIQMQNQMNDCDVLFGIKEVPLNDLIPNKTYFFFSHTKKKQAHNQKLMMSLIDKKIKMIDYEALTFENGKRIIGFGFFAGVVGAHNAILTYGKKTGMFKLTAANQCKDMAAMEAQYATLKLPALKLVVTGDGRVGQGIVHIMKSMNIQSVSPEDFKNKTFDYPVYTHLTNDILYRKISDHSYNRDEFHKNPERYECLFMNYAHADILINGIYWETKIPRLFERSQVHNEHFNIKVIADVTCDENGSVPINLGASTIQDPVYGYHKIKDEQTLPFQNNDDIIDVMAVDNLPNELPRDASEAFGKMITDFIIPELKKTQSDILDRATICENGKLGKHFEYLQDYAFPNKVRVN